MKSYYVYILKCSDDSYYTGVTNDMERRIQEHQDGYSTEAYTYGRRPVTLVFTERYTDIRQAIAFEKILKKWSRAKKEAVIANRWEQLGKLSACKNSTTHKNYKGNKSRKVK